MAEKEYIRKVDVVNHLYDIQKDKFADSDYKKFAWAMEIFIDRSSTADVQPVVHAKWITTNLINVYGGKEIKCSACGEKFIVSPEVYENLKYLERFCRHCGAKMDEKEY